MRPGGGGWRGVHVVTWEFASQGGRTKRVTMRAWPCDTMGVRFSKRQS
jgi:hypothetical protein